MQRFDAGITLLLSATLLIVVAGCARDDLIARQGAETSVMAELPEPVAEPTAETEEAPEAVVISDGEQAAAVPAPPVPGAGTPGAAQPRDDATSPTASATPAPAPAESAPVTPAPSPATPAVPAAAPPAEPQGTVVLGAITVVSHVPQPSEVPYSDCLTMIKYTVERVESGEYQQTELLAAFWGMRGAKLEPPARFRVGQRHRLTIEPLSKHPDLSRVMQADDTNEYSLTPYWVLSFSDA